MNKMSRNKSRSRLYNLIAGANELVGAAGATNTGSSIQLGAVAIPTDTIQIGDYYFEFQLAASEAAGTSAGTAADPHLVAHGANVLASVTNLAAQILAETATTGAWGYLYPDDSVGIVNDGVDKLTFTFWPGTWANTLAFVDGCATASTLVQPSAATAGVAAKYVSPDYKTNIIDTTGSAANQEYYILDDGLTVGETCTVTVKTFAAGDTPTILGHLSEAGVAMVEAEFVTAEPGASITFEWNGTVWEMISFNTLHTVPNFTASA